MIKLAQFTAFGTVSAQVVAQVSLVLHVAVCLLAMDVTLATTPARIRLGRGGRAHVIGVAAGTLLYALHPMRAQVLSWSSCQPYVCAALFALLAVRCHLKRLRLRTMEADRRGSGRGLILGSATCLFYLCATLTKSAAVPTGAVIVFTSMLHSAGYLGCHLVSSGGSGTTSNPLPPLRILPMQLKTVFMGLLGEIPTVLIAVLTSALALRANLTTQGAAPPEQTLIHHHAHHVASGTTTPPPPLAFAAASTTAALRRIVWPSMRSAYTVLFYLLRSVTSGAWGKEHAASPWYRAEPTLHATECTSTQGPDIHQACQDLAANQAAAYPLGVHIVAFAAAVGMTLWSFALLATPTNLLSPISPPTPPLPSSSLAAEAEAGKTRGPTATRKRTAAAADGPELAGSAAPLALNHAAWVWCRRGVAVLWLLYGAVLAPTVGVFAHHGPSHQGLKGIAGIVGADRYMYFAGILGIPLLGFAATALELSLSPSPAPRAAKASSSSTRTVGFIVAAAAVGFIAVTAWNARQGERGM
jgi:hypothetical protein